MSCCAPSKGVTSDSDSIFRCAYVTGFTDVMVFVVLAALRQIHQGYRVYVKAFFDVVITKSKLVLFSFPLRCIQGKI